MSWNVLHTATAIRDDVLRPALELLERSGCAVHRAEGTGPFKGVELAGLLEGRDAVLAGIDAFSAAILESSQAARLKIISRWGVGYDAIDVPAATSRGIVIANTPNLLNDAVADYTFALLFALARRVHEGHLSMRDGGWKVSWGHDLSGKTLGIVGCGRIGQAVARRAGGFGMKLFGFDLFPNEDAKKLGVGFVELEALLASSDFICLHCALTPETRGLINEARLRRMKPTAYLINTARGAIVDETALVRALHEGWIAGAALDAFCVEPLPTDHPLRRAPNVLLTPHQASFGHDTGQRVSLAAAQAIVDLRSGRAPASVVNADVLRSPALRARLH